eukprot:11202188-Lingulodinium_polyedra.AAC.1
MRSNRVSVATAACQSHASRVPCKHPTWCLHGVCEACDLRVVVPADGRFDRIIVHGFKNRAE